MILSYTQTIYQSKSSLFKGCAAISWLILGKILCDRKNFGIDYGGLEVLTKFNQFFQIERPDIRSDQFIGSKRYRPKISVH